ncbi:MAG: hypothetical protein APF82_08890 [Sphingomonadales bacterium BRH_c42]|nr:MAG: hypothetical protein APF82_08890 [Sphingomonadales bacterium BRH_c42]
MMGRIDNISGAQNNSAVDLPKGVHLVAGPQTLEAIAGLGRSVRAIPCGIESPLPLGELSGASIVVIEVDPHSRNSLERVDLLRSQLPAVPVIAGLADVDIATSRQLLRRGVSDIVALPFAIDELVTAICDTAEQTASEVTAQARLAPFIAVLKTIGGSGATTVATHLAAQMAHDMGDHARACVIDLDLQTGDVASYMGCSPRLTLTELMDAGGRLDDELIRSVACDSKKRVDVIAAPAEIVPIEDVDFEQLMRIVTAARRLYDVVVVDLPASFTNWSLSTVFAADQTLLVSTLTLPSLRHAKRQLDFMLSMGIARSAIQIVLNRVEMKLFKSIDAGDAARVLRHPVLATICNDYKLLNNAQDEGELVGEIQRKCRFVKEIAVLSESLAARLEETR